MQSSSDGETSEDTQDFLSVYWLYFAVSLTIPVCGIIMPEARWLPGIHGRRKKTLEQQLAPVVAVKSQSELQKMDQDQDNEEEEEKEELFETPDYSIREILSLS